MKIALDARVRSRWPQRAALAVLALVVALVLGECYARLTVPDFDNVGPPAIFTSSEVIPFATRPLAVHLEVRHPRGEYVYAAHLDARGFRHNGPRPAGDLDGRGTLILGDSFAFGMGVNNNQTVSAELDRSELGASCLGPVVNGGWTAGNNPATAAAWLAAQGPQLRARSLVHLVFPTNDLDDIVPLELHRDSRGDLVRVTEEVAYVDESGRRRFSDRAGLRGARDWLRNHLRLYYPVYQWLKATFPETFGEYRTVRRDLDGARQVAIGAMQQAERWAAARSAGYTAVFVPSAQEVQAGRWQEKGGSLIAAARGAGLEVVDLLEGQPRLTLDHYYRHDPHWNPSGHAAVARQLLPHLTARARRACAADPAAADTIGG